MNTKKSLYNKLLKTIKIKKDREINNKSIKSFSPYINRKLDVKKLQTLKNNKIRVCNNLLEINIGDNIKPHCLKFDNVLVQKYLLKNLKGSKHLDPTKFIAPKQLHSNCWFNTMFVVFFFSDKGRKFFRFFRNLMITGKKYDNTPLHDQELRKLLFIFNLYIEASYNQDLNTNNINNEINLHNQIKKLTFNLDTNYLIMKIYDRITKISPNYYLPNIYEAGNPLEFYEIIMSYMNYNILNILRINIDSSSKKRYTNILQKLNNSFYKDHDMIIIEDHKSGMKYDEEYEIEFNKQQYKYKLDSIILTNKDHYNPNANSHFVSVITINKKPYKFDGSSYSKLTKFNWKKILNKNTVFTFVENPKYYPEKYTLSTKYGYKILFYYKI